MLKDNQPRRKPAGGVYAAGVSQQYKNHLTRHSQVTSLLTSMPLKCHFPLIYHTFIPKIFMTWRNAVIANQRIAPACARHCSLPTDVPSSIWFPHSGEAVANAGDFFLIAFQHLLMIMLLTRFINLHVDIYRAQAINR